MPAKKKDTPSPAEPVKRPAAGKNKAPAPAVEAVAPAAPVEPAAPAPQAPIMIPAPVPPAAAALASEKPGAVTAIAVLTLVSGIVNILAGLVGGLALAGTIVLICLAPFGLLPILLGVFEIIYAAKLIPNPIRPTAPSQTIAILEIVCFLFGNVLSAIAGILALVFYADPGVKAYFAKYGLQS